MPATVESVLASRIDRLSQGDKRLLQSAAVIGYRVPLGVLQAVWGAFLRKCCDRRSSACRPRSSCNETSLFPELEYTFRHALMHDVAYRSLSLDRRRVLHTAALNAGERLYSDEIPEKAEWLAFHALRGRRYGTARCAISGRRRRGRSGARRAGSRSSIWRMR